jgi:hypothetical protein
MLNKVPKEIVIQFHEIIKEYNVSFTIAKHMEDLLIKSHNIGYVHGKSHERNLNTEY